MAVIEKLRFRRSDIASGGANTPKTVDAAKRALESGLSGKEYGEAAICPYGNALSTQGMVLGIKSFDNVNVYFTTEGGGGGTGSGVEYTAEPPIYINGENVISIKTDELESKLNFQTKIATVYAPITLEEEEMTIPGVGVEKKLALKLLVSPKTDNAITDDNGSLYVPKSSVSGGGGGSKNTVVYTSAPCLVQVSPSNDIEIVKCQDNTGVYGVKVDADSFSEGAEHTVIFYNDSPSGGSVRCSLDRGGCKGTIASATSVATKTIAKGEYVEFNFLFAGGGLVLMRYD